MSLLAKRIGLILLSAQLIFSCKEKETVGLDLPQDEVGVFYTEALPISTFASLKNDSIATHNQDFIYAGAYADPKFGDVKAEAFTQLLLTDASLDDASYSVVDSVIMTLAYDYHYGDTTQPQTIHVHPLTVAIDPSDPYYTTSPALAFDPTFVDADVAFQAKPGTKTQRIELTDVFGENILTDIGTGTTNALFTTNFEGIALIPKNDNEGAVLKIKLNGTSKIKIYFKNLSAVRDSAELLMSNGGKRFSRITSDRSGIPVLSTLPLVSSGDSVNANGEVYLQSGIGIRTKIEFPTLSDFKNSLGNIVINRAQLVIEMNSADIDPYYNPIGYLHLLKLDTAGNIRQYLHSDGSYRNQEVQRDMFDINGTTVPMVVYYNSTLKSYTFDISTYLNAMLYGLEENNGLIIAPHPDVNSFSVNRAFADAAKVKMKIYYTQVK